MNSHTRAPAAGKWAGCSVSCHPRNSFPVQRKGRGVASSFYGDSCLKDAGANKNLSLNQWLNQCPPFYVEYYLFLLFSLIC